MSKYIKLEDAISEADRLLGIVLDTDFNEGVEHGILTIKFALLDLPTLEVEEDCISREELLKDFDLSEKSRKYGGDHSGYQTLMLYEIQDIIEDAPSVVPTVRKNRTVEQSCDTCKHNKLEWFSEECDGCTKANSNYEPTTKQSSKVGKWIADRYCSECEWDKSNADYTSGWRENYCPACGAKMRLE